MVFLHRRIKNFNQILLLLYLLHYYFVQLYIDMLGVWLRDSESCAIQNHMKIRGKRGRKRGRERLLTNIFIYNKYINYAGYIRELVGMPSKYVGKVQILTVQ